MLLFINDKKVAIRQPFFYEKPRYLSTKVRSGRKISKRMIVAYLRHARQMDEFFFQLSFPAMKRKDVKEKSPL